MVNLSSDIPAVVYVALLFAGFVALWAVKRAEQKARYGVDPLVMGRSEDPLQRYFARMTVVIEVAFVALTVLNGLGLYDVWGFQRLTPLDRSYVDVIGLCVGVMGLALCRSAQVTMGSAWRVGIDEDRSTELVETGAFRYVRNPTYSGLFLLVFGVWLIWPTPLVALVGLLFVVLLEVQVRSEERFLLERHGERYATYQARTKRYVPWVY
jgi:protein-S-isoprenylcysteine O-methyltransferase Ste14